MSLWWQDQYLHVGLVLWGRQQEVLRLQVPVHHAALVQELDGIDEAACDDAG
jgi:hypothetical protein